MGRFSGNTTGKPKLPDDLEEKRKEIKELDQQIEELEEERQELHDELMEEMKDRGIESAEGASYVSYTNYSTDKEAMHRDMKEAGLDPEDYQEKSSETEFVRVT